MSRSNPDIFSVNAQQTRVLSLLPGSWSSPIRGHLKRIALDGSAAYQTVSYAWGDPHDMKTILVDGRARPIPSNLEVALRYLRSSTEAIDLWADAISINQQDSMEKAMQVAMMGEIFRLCSSAYIWLGLPNTEPARSSQDIYDENQTDPFTIVHHFAQNKHHSQLPCFRVDQSTGEITFHEDSDFDVIWKAFKDASTKPWWSRFWCVQECLLAPSAMVVLGQWRIPWKLIKLSEVNYRQHISTCCTKSLAMTPETYSFYTDSAVVSTGFEPNSNTIFAPGKIMDLDLVLRSFRYKVCQDPRDKIYGILGLVDKSKYLNLTVNYDLSVREVYVNAMESLFFDGAGDLRCLTGSAFNSPEHDLPSWVRDFAAHQDLGSSSSELTRLKSYKLYNAAKSTNAKPSLKEGYVLSLYGAFVDRITYVGKPIEQRSWPHVIDVVKHWRDLASTCGQRSCPEMHFDDQREIVFWLTIFADVVFHDEQTPQRIQNEDVESLRSWITHMLAAFEDGNEYRVEPWLRSMVSATYGRVFFTTEQHNFGLCYPNCRSGDELWVLEGGKVPFVVRSCQQGQQQGMAGAQHYRFIGECYLHNFMDGEVFASPDVQTTEIVFV